MILEGASFEVIDAGIDVDVAAEKFVEIAKEKNASLLQDKNIP